MGDQFVVPRPPGIWGVTDGFRQQKEWRGIPGGHLGFPAPAPAGLIRTDHSSGQAIAIDGQMGDTS